MKRIALITCLLLPIPLQAQDFLQPDTWWYIDTIMPLNDYHYQYMCDEHRTPTGILAWQNDTIAFAEYRHYEYYRLYVMKAPRHWVKTLEQLADAATMTANHFVGEWMGISLTQLRVPGRAATNNSPTYGRALQLDSLMNKITTSVMQNDSASMYWHIIAAHNLGRSFRLDYPLSWYRPGIGIGYAYRGKFDIDAMEQEQNKRWQWIKPLTEQHDLFRPYVSSIGNDAPTIFLDGQYLKVTQQCNSEVDSIMTSQFALGRREEFVQLSRTLFVGGYEPKVEITLSDTVSQRCCYIDELHCRLLLPSSTHLLDVVIPDGPGTFVGYSTSGWERVDEKEFKKWWNWYE